MCPASVYDISQQCLVVWSSKAELQTFLEKYGGWMIRVAHVNLGTKRLVTRLITNSALQLTAVTEYPQLIPWYRVSHTGLRKRE
ncbi:hypothetical protein IF2G_01346 [Cordyceps javanica]|nr:hypothetical protein IF2G_01346 [Cordyceps javanica]